MELILLSYPSFFPKEVNCIISLMENYDFIFHLRKPAAHFNEYKQIIKEIPYQFHKRIVLHDAYDLQKEFRVKGLHFSSAQRNISFEIKSCGTKSTSCHSLDEIKKLDGKFDYMFLSPVFKSISKKGYTGNLDMQEVKEYLKKPRKSKIIALGGIDEKTYPSLHGYKFNGIALLGAVWTTNPGMQANFENNLQRIIQCIHHNRIVQQLPMN